MAIHRNTHVQEMHDIQITPLSTQPIHSFIHTHTTCSPMDRWTTDRPSLYYYHMIGTYIRIAEKDTDTTLLTSKNSHCTVHDIVRSYLYHVTVHIQKKKERSRMAKTDRGEGGGCYSVSLHVCHKRVNVYHERLIPMYSVDHIYVCVDDWGTSIFLETPAPSAVELFLPQRVARPDRHF
jgi:hypothetical protein